jgi:hypothetical protein
MNDIVILCGKYIGINCEGIELGGKENCFTVYWLLFVVLFKAV